MTDRIPHSTDIFMDAEGNWRVLYSDGSVGKALTLDEMLDACANLGEPVGEVTAAFQ